MAGQMPLRNASKGPVFRKLDAAFANAVTRANGLRAGLGGDSLWDIALAQGILTAAEVARIGGRWFPDEPPAWWPGYPGKINIVTEGYRKALELSLGFHFNPERPATAQEVDTKLIEISGNIHYGKPVVTTWLCAGHHFQCLIEETPQQVTLLLLTPSVPQNVVPDKPMTHHQSLWLVSNKVDADALRQAATFPGGPHTLPVSEERIMGTMVTPIYGEVDGAFESGT